MPAPALGYTGAAAVQLVRDKASAPTTPADARVYAFLNLGLEQVADALNLTLAFKSQAVLAGAIKVALPADVQDMVALTWSTADPTAAAGVMEYPVAELGPLQFVDATWNAPTTGAGPVVLFRRLTDTANVITVQIYPAAPSGGFLNTYYKQRVTLYDPADGTSTTNIDTAYQYLAIIFACSLVADSKKDYKGSARFLSEFESKLEEKRTLIGRRNRQRGSVVRDVSAGGAVLPTWWPGGE